VADRPSEEERRRLIRQYQTIVGGITSILFRLDQVGIADDNPHRDEYASEAAMISRYLPEAKDLSDLEGAIRQVFVSQFGEPLPGHGRDYHEVALEVWRFAAEVRKGPSG